MRAYIFFIVEELEGTIMIILISVVVDNGAYRLPGRNDVQPMRVSERGSAGGSLLSLFVIDVDADEEVENIRLKLLHQYHQGEIYSMKLTLL